MELEETRNLLQQALDKQFEDQKRQIDANRRLQDQQITYANEARGTLYSGMPTWQRTQLAVETSPSIAKINQNYAKNKINLWNSVQDTIDQINAYNEAAQALGGGVAGVGGAVETSTSVQPTTSAPFILNGEYYKYENGRLVKV